MTALQKYNASGFRKYRHRKWYNFLIDSDSVLKEIGLHQKHFEIIIKKDKYCYAFYL